MKSLKTLSVVGGALLALSSTVHAAPFGTVTVLAPVPSPGFPEGIAIRGAHAYVAGPATFGTADNGIASPVWEYSTSSGELTRTLPAKGEVVFGAEHANSCVAFDGLGRLYVLNTQIGTYRLNLLTEAQKSYTQPFPDLPSCPQMGQQPVNCTPTPDNAPALPNDLAFDAAGNLYVTDSLQATIYRIRPGNPVPEVWFQDARLATPPGAIGVNGIRISPDRRRVFFSVSVDLQGLGRVYSLPLANKPKSTDLNLFHTYDMGEGPDGIAFGAVGKLYVALAFPGHSGISILKTNGAEETAWGTPFPT